MSRAGRAAEPWRGHFGFGPKGNRDNVVAQIMVNRRRALDRRVNTPHRLLGRDLRTRTPGCPAPAHIDANLTSSLGDVRPNTALAMAMANAVVTKRQGDDG